MTTTHRSVRPTRAQRARAYGPVATERSLAAPERTRVAPDPVALPAPEPVALPAPRPAPAAVAPDRPRYLPALDGLRAVAVVAVVAFHLGRLDGGFLGVDVFFVLSGFLITRLLIAERASTGRISLRAFWGRRVRRLLPAVLAVLPAVAIASKLWLPAWRLTDVRNDAFAALFYVANWRFVASGQSYFADGVAPSPLRHTWSLAVEEQFYVLWPLLVLGVLALAGRRRHAGVAVFAGAVTLASAGWMSWSAGRGGDLTRVYYGTDTRIFAMAAGAVVATFADRWRAGAEAATEAGADAGRRLSSAMSTLGVLALVGLLIGFVVGREDEAAFYRGGFQGVALLAAVVVASLAFDRGPLARALGVPPLRWVGQRSYSIYLWSWPVQILGRARFGWLTGWTFDAAVVVVTVLCASLSFAFVERPVLAGRLPLRLRVPSASGSPAVARVAGRRWARPTAAFASVAAVAGLLVATSAGSPPAPDYLSVDDDDVTQQVLSTERFATGRATAGQRPSATVPPTTATPATGGEAAAPQIVDPGPNPPFDPDAPVVVDVVDRAPADVFDRPLRVVIVGDSVGWSIGWELEGRLRPAVDLQIRALIGCGTIGYGPSWGVAGRGWYPYKNGCEEQAEAERLGLEAGPDVVLLWIGAWEVFDQRVDGRELEVGSTAYAERLRADLQRRIDAARAAGVPIVMPVVPCFGPSEQPEYNVRRLDPDAIAWVNEQARFVAERNPGWVRLIDPSNVLCDAQGEPRTEVAGVALRQDGAHFDRDAARWFWDAWLGPALASAYPTPVPSA